MLFIGFSSPGGVLTPFARHELRLAEIRFSSPGGVLIPFAKRMGLSMN